MKTTKKNVEVFCKANWKPYLVKGKIIRKSRCNKILTVLFFTHGPIMKDIFGIGRSTKVSNIVTFTARSDGKFHEKGTSIARSKYELIF